MCGGLEVQLTKYRRGEDANLFKAYTNLYQWADCVDRASVAMAVNQIANSYPFQREGIEHYFVMSHKKRMQLNHAMNAGFAASQQKVLFIAGPKDIKETSGVSMQGQDMIIWKGLELLCNARKYAPKSPVNGCVYIVESWDETHVVVRLHADYMPRSVEPLAAEPVEVEDDVSDLEDMGEDGDEAPAKEPTRQSIWNLVKRLQTNRNRKNAWLETHYAKTEKGALTPPSSCHNGPHPPCGSEDHPQNHRLDQRTHHETARTDKRGDC
jgi:hypothetical protein